MAEQAINLSEFEAESFDLMAAKDAQDQRELAEIMAHADELRARAAELRRAAGARHAAILGGIERRHGVKVPRSELRRREEEGRQVLAWEVEDHATAKGDTPEVGAVPVEEEATEPVEV